MARAAGQRTRAAARSHGKYRRCPKDSAASNNIVSRAFTRTDKAGALAWLSGFNAGFHGASYVRPLGTLDSQVWAAGFIEGRGCGRRM
jgi:hypothetical protein